jgi:hypothetical protein
LPHPLPSPGSARRSPLLRLAPPPSEPYATAIRASVRPDGGLRARGGGRAEAVEAAGAPRRRAPAAASDGDAPHPGGRAARRRAAAALGADGVRGGVRPGVRRHPRRAQLPALRVRPPRPARAHPAAGEGGRPGRRLRARRRHRHPARAVVAALHHAQPRMRRAPRRAHGRAGELDRILSAVLPRFLAFDIFFSSFLCPVDPHRWIHLGGVLGMIVCSIMAAV